MDGIVKGCGVLVCDKHSNILLGLRSDGQGWCTAGGKVDEGETHLEAAARELKEEFNITAYRLTPLSYITSEAVVHGEKKKVGSYIYICTWWNTADKPIPNEEMLDFKWVSIKEALDMEDLFPPTRKALQTASSMYFMGMPSAK